MALIPNPHISRHECAGSRIERSHRWKAVMGGVTSGPPEQDVNYANESYSVSWETKPAQSAF